MLNCKIAMAAAVLGAYGLNAADVTFPNSDGQGDLASPASWGLAELPDSTNRIAFTKGGGNVTLTATEDIDFAGIYHNGESRAITLDMRNEKTGANPGPRKINLTGAIGFGTSWQAKLYIKGGEWNLNGKSITLFKTYSDVAGLRLGISDGACIYGVGDLVAGIWGDRVARTDIAGEGTVVTASTFKVGFYDSNNDIANLTDGASLVVTGTSNGTLKIADGNSSNCVFVISNNANFVKSNSSFNYLSGKRGGNCLRVLEGATATVSGSSYLGHADDPANCASSHNNTILVSGTSAVTNSSLSVGDIYLGSMTGVDSSTFNTNNCIVVRDGARFKAGIIRLFGARNGIVVSNAVVSLTGGSGIVCGNTSRGCTNCFVRLQGDHPELIHSSSLNGNAAFNNSFHFIYDLPPDGYAAGIVPVRLNKWLQMFDSTEFVFNGIEEMQASMRRRRVSKASYLVFAATAGVNASQSGVPQSCLDRCNSNLPQGAELTGDSGRTRLYLTVQSLAGTMMIFR